MNRLYPFPVLPFRTQRARTCTLVLIRVLDRRPPMQHALPRTPFPASPHFAHPPAQLIAPAPTNQHPTHNIHQPDAQRQQSALLLGNGEQDGLDVEFEEDAGDHALADHVRLGGDSVLVRDDGVFVSVEVGRGGGGEGAGVDGGHDGEVVLEFEEVERGGVEGAVERVEEGGVEGPEGEFGDEVREVEGFFRSSHTHISLLFFKKKSAGEYCGPGAEKT